MSFYYPKFAAPGSLFAGILLGFCLSSSAFAQEPLKVEGLITPSASAKVPSKGNGIVYKLLVRENAVVKEGDVILQLDDQEQKLELEARKAISGKADADARIASRLFQENVASRDERDRAAVEAQTAQANYDLARLKFEHCAVRTPISGRVVKITKDLGEAVQAMEAVAEVVDFETVDIVVYLDAAYMGRIHVGDPVTVQGGISATIFDTDSVVDPGSGIFRVKVRAENSEKALIPGRRCEVIFSDLKPAADNK